METKWTAKKLALIGMFGALGGVLMFFEFPLTFIAPAFYEIDLGEIPVMISTFMLGPVAGVITEFVKIIVKLLLKGTSTGYVGDFANFCVGCALVIPAGIIYKYKKTKAGALIGMLTGTIIMAVAGIIMNYFIMIPFYSKLMPLDQII
ncbi:MAG: ECF transporter S component, partial [Eubacterium sp.]